MASLKSSSDALDTPAKQGASGKKGKRNPDMAAMAQALVSESRVPPGKRKIRVLSLGMATAGEEEERGVKKGGGGLRLSPFLLFPPQSSSDEY